MAKFELTNKQKEAVFTYGKDIILSAAAGSGKTGVLTQRVLELVCDGADISRMLVVTFTDAAAAEMRSRIRLALEDRAAENGNARLARQAQNVSAADISTMHSFASKVIRENFALLDLRADIRVAGETQTMLIKQEAIEACFAAFYEKDDALFLWLRDRYSGRTDAELEELVFSIYAAVQSYPEGSAWLKDAGTIKTEVYMDFVNRQIVGKLVQLADLAAEAIALHNCYEYSPAQLEKDEIDQENILQLKTAFSAGQMNSYAALLAQIKIPNISKIQDDIGKSLLQENKKQTRSLLKELAASAPAQMSGQLQAEVPYMQQLGEALYYVVDSFAQNYTALKREAGLMDFDDMMHYALQLLSMQDVAKTYSGRYDYLFVDEYQDTNSVQDALVNALTLPAGGRFSVGDMKQSIYRFRLADPLIFKQKVQGLQKAENGHAIFMNENFRSTPQVISMVNFVMQKLMSEQLGEIIYDENESLKPVVDLPGHTELLLTDTAEGMEKEKDNTVKEAHTIARRIKDLLRQKKQDGSEYQLSDICILLRNSAGNDQIFAKTLARHGIPAQTAKAKTATNPDVVVFVNLLRVIDGFYSDVALLSVMRSYIGGFTELDFAVIRQVDHKDTFCNCFLSYAQKTDALAQKCKTLLEKIDRFRLYARAMQMQDFLILLKEETKYEAFTAALPEGERKLNQFIAFFSWCVGEAEQVQSLHSLIARMEAIYHKNGTYGGSIEGKQGNFVRIMSIHNAKGLEFPIVFLARLQTAFSIEDFKKPISLHKNFGIASDGINAEARTKAGFVCKQILKDVLAAEQKSEELRVLYVAMTRAKEQLILSAAVKEPQKTIAKYAGRDKAYELCAMGSMLQWLLAVLFEKNISEEMEPTLCAGVQMDIIIAPSADGVEAEGTMQKDGAEEQMLLQAAALPYAPFLAYEKQQVPVKMGVSALLPQDDMGANIPAYVMSTDTGAEFGNLVHLFLQHMDLSLQTEEDIDCVLQQMVNKLLITPQEQKRIFGFAQAFLDFLHSDIAKRARNAKNLQREVAFSLQVNANEVGLADTPDPIILQGIIDMLFEEPEGFVIVDYKSNMADEARMAQLAERYRIQVAAYKLAVERITKKPVKECYLWFLRAGQKFRVF